MGDRIALVGSNGAGKSTFMKILLGEMQADCKEIEKANYVTLGYLPQEGIVAKGKSIFKEVESAFEDVIAIQRHLKQANERLEKLDPSSQDYFELLEILGGLEHRLEDLEAHKIKSKVEKVLLGLGFKISDMERDCGEFSGGWQMRIALAKLLLYAPSLLMLDEPTNHLDLPSQRWLEAYLSSYDGALLIISHDRAFLDSLCNRTFALSLGKLENYAGNYSFYEQESLLRTELREKAYLNQQRALAKQERFIERFRAKSSKAKQVQSRIKQLEKIEKIALDKEEKRIHFSFPKAPASGHVVLQMKNVCKSFGQLVVYKNLDFKLEAKDRVAVVGLNGTGKSTLARIIAGLEPIDSGQKTFGHNVKFSYFAQQQADALDPRNQVIEVIENAANSISGINLRTILGAFLFRGEDVFKKVSVLSGGEKCRLALACLLVQKANFLILDEPTNHLDMASKAMLQEALLRYEGTLLIVSHDRAFLDPIVNKVLEVSQEGTRLYLGNVSEYLERVENNQPSIPLNENKVKKEQSLKTLRKENAQRRETLKPLKKEVKELETRISEAEQEKARLGELLNDPEFFKKSESAQTVQKYHALEKRIEKAYEQWESINKKIEVLSQK